MSAVELFTIRGNEKMLVVDGDTVYRVGDNGEYLKLCILNAPTRVSLCDGAGITLGSINKCLCIGQR